MLRFVMLFLCLIRQRIMNSTFQNMLINAVGRKIETIESENTRKKRAIESLNVGREIMLVANLFNIIALLPRLKERQIGNYFRRMIQEINQTN
jgi:hypothetical protein